MTCSHKLLCSASFLNREDLAKSGGKFLSIRADKNNRKVKKRQP